MITANQVVEHWRSTETNTKGEVSFTWAKIKNFHCHIRQAKANESVVSDRLDTFIDAKLVTSYPNIDYRDVIRHRERSYRVEGINLREGPQNVYEADLRRDHQAEEEISQV